MPATMNSLTSQQKQTLAFIIAFVLAVAASGGMLYRLGTEKAQAASALADVERKEIQAQTSQMPSPEDLEQWSSIEQQLSSVLISDQTVPLFFEEVTRIGTQNGLQPTINTEEKVLDPAKSPTPEEIKLMEIGITKYLLMTITFRGGYPEVARFLSEVSRLQRPVEFRNIRMRRAPPFVDVSLTMHVYKRELE